MNKNVPLAENPADLAESSADLAESSADLAESSAIPPKKKDASSELKRLGELRKELARIGYAYEERTGTSEEKHEDPTLRIGMHYTPLETASKIVTETLRPLLFRENGSPKNSEELLQLRIFDPALGAGVFLLETCFQLTEFLCAHEGWDPEIPAKITKNCLFGTDIDAQAVEISRSVLKRFCAPYEKAAEGAFAENLHCADSLKLPIPEENAKFDAVLGNPPYLGGRKIRRVLGDAYFRFLTQEFLPGASGNADLSVYFLHLAERFLKPGGVCGLLMTNSIAEGDSRKTGLDPILARGGEIYSVDSFPWLGNAAVHVTAIHLNFPKGKTRTSPLLPVLNGICVPRIFASLKHLDSSLTSYRFPENETLCYQGCVLAAKGFILTMEEARTLWEKDEKYRNVVLPYFTGDDIFSAPDPMKMTPRRCVISFRDWTLEQAEEYPLALAIVRERVLPVRQNARRAAHRERWWHFGDKRPVLMKTIQEKQLKKLLIQTRHSKFLAPTWVPTDAVYSESTILFPTESPELLALLNSGVHETWVRETSSSLGKELRYSPTDCFDTFALPELKLADLRFFELRCELCQRWRCGLTALQHRFHDPKDPAPELEALRELTAASESVIFRAYGWTDLEAVYEFHETPRGIRFELTFPLQEELLHRLTQAQNFRFLYS